MRQLPRPGEIYKHFKGNCYRIITIATHSETGEKLVIYQALYGDFAVYARELSMFMGAVDKEKYPFVTQKMRFEFLESGAAEIAKPQDVSRRAADSAVSEQTENAEWTIAQNSIAHERTEGAGQTAVSDAVSKTAVNVGTGMISELDKKQSPEKQAEPGVDPGVLAYLDADTCKEKLQILTTMRDRLTDAMINTMAIAIDVEVKPGDITERYEELKYCLATKERFECRRLR